MKKIIFIILILSFISNLFSFSLPSQQKMKIAYICNTIDRVKKALKEGKEIIEIDLQMTKDYQIVLRHDPIVEYNGQFCSSFDLTLNELQKSRNLEINQFQPEISNQNILTLADFLSELRVQNGHYDISQLKLMIHINNLLTVKV